jgi:hypothetical protein
MEISKNGPYDFGKLTCVVNAIIEVLELKITKLNSAGSGEINSALLKIDQNYKSTFLLSSQWQQTVVLLERMDQNLRQRILIQAENKFKFLQQNGTLI